MKKLSLFIATALLATFWAASRPASPHPVVITDADGVQRLVRIIGNEDRHYLVDAETGVPLEFDSSQRVVERKNVPDRRSPVMRIGYDSRGRSIYPTTRGKYRFPVILVEFEDTPFSMENPKQYYEALFNQKGFDRDGAIGSVKDYFTDCSNARFSPEFMISDVVKLPHPAKYYTGRTKDEHFPEAVQYALKRVDEEINFSLTDNDNDGTIDQVFVIFSGIGQADSANPDVVWPHSAVYPYPAQRVDGKLVRSYACCNELRYPDLQPAGIGGPCYELARMIGIPDLSGDDTKTVSTPGEFSLMDQGSYNAGGAIPPRLSAYEQWVCRWLEYGDAVTEPGRYSVKALSETDRQTLLLVPDNTSHEDIDEYYIVETRADDKWDASLPDHGILFWHVAYNEFYWSYNWVNAYGSIRVHPVASRPEDGLVTWPGGDAAYYWMEASDTDLIKRFNRHTSGENAFPPTIGYISYDADTKTGSFTYDTKLDFTNDATRITAAERTEWNGDAVMILWEPVKDDDVEYMLKVCHPGVEADSVVNLFPGEWRLCKEPRYECRGFGDDFEMEWTATVAVVRGLPSPEWSEPLKFVPSKAPWASGIEEVETDTDTPEYYTLQGIRVARPTAPGIYVERRGGKTRKIAVGEGRR